MSTNPVTAVLVAGLTILSIGLEATWKNLLFLIWLAKGFSEVNLFILLKAFSFCIAAFFAISSNLLSSNPNPNCAAAAITLGGKLG